MKRVWKPVDVGGLRLYQVEMKFHAHPEWNEKFIVAADSPRGASKLIQDIYKDASWLAETPFFFGKALDCLIPESWWTDGIPCQHERDPLSKFYTGEK